MFSDYLREVLLFRQGWSLSEDAVSIFNLPRIPGMSSMSNWDELMRFCITPDDYIFKKDYRQDFVVGIETQLSILEYMKPIFESDEFNHRIYLRQRLALQKVKAALSEADLGDINKNPFAVNWSSMTHGGQRDVYHAWRLYIGRLALALTKACAIRVGEHGDNDEAAADELAAILTDVFYVLHHAHPS